jgi:hypothetical protein
MRKRIFLCGLMLVFVFHFSFGQITLDFQSRSHFNLQVNGHLINQYPCERLVFDAVLTDGKCNLKTTLASGEIFEQNLSVKDGFKLDYQLGKDKKDKWKWMLMGETIIQLDTAAINQIPSLGPVYAGSRKCNAPVPSEQMEKWIEELKDIHRTEERLSKLKNATANSCLQVEQVLVLLSQIELEDDRLSLLNFWVDKIYDWDERQQIVKAFITERAQNKAALLLN